MVVGSGGSEADGLDELGMRARDEVRADQLADALRGFGAGVDGGFHAADVAFDDHGDEATADLNLANEGDVGRFDHSVAGFDAAYIAFGFYHADGITHDVFLFLVESLPAQAGGGFRKNGS